MVKGPLPAHRMRGTMAVFMSGMSGGYPSLSEATRAGVGQYELVAKLGEGGMADVFLAVARGPVEDFHKLVVLKRLRDSLRSDEDFVKMFLKEARIAARLSHPNVVHTYSVDIDDGHPVIVMEYLDGVALGALLKRGVGRPFADRLPLLGAVVHALAGLHYVHELADYDGTPLKLVHRDIKPGNLFVTFDGQAKVVDFGIAKATARTQEQTQSMALKGTARYMSPEAVGKSDTIDRRADIFSAGVMLWEIASAKKLWAGADDLQIIRRLMDNEVPPLDAVADDIPEALSEICRKALQVDRDERYETAETLRADLAAFVESQGLTDIGAALAEMAETEFGHRRHKRSEAIRARLEHMQHAPPDDDPGVDDVPTLTPAGDASSNRTALSDDPPPRRGAGWYATVGAVATVLVGGGYLLMRSGDDGGSASSAGTPANAEASPKSDPESADAPAAAGVVGADEGGGEDDPAAAAVPPEADGDDAAVPPQPAEEAADAGAAPDEAIADAPTDAPADGTPDEAAADPSAAKPGKSGRKKAGGRKPATPPQAPPATPEASKSDDGGLQPGQMPTKKTKKKSGLKLDKDSPWGNAP